MQYYKLKINTILYIYIYMYKITIIYIYIYIYNIKRPRLHISKGGGSLDGRPRRVPLALLRGPGLLCYTYIHIYIYIYIVD